MRLLPFLRDQLLERRTRSASLKQPCLLIKPLDRAELLVSSQLRIPDGGLQHAYRFVVHPQRNRERVPVFAAVSEREPRGIGEAIRGSIHNFGNHSQGADGSRPHSGSQEQYRKVGGPAIGCRRQISVQPLCNDYPARTS